MEASKLSNSRDKLIENYEEAVFALMVDELALTEGKRLIEENERLREDPAFDLPNGFEDRGVKRIRKAFLRTGRIRVMNTAIKTLQRVAVVFLVVGILFIGCFSTITAFRTTVLNFLLDTYQTHTTISIGEENNSNAISVAEGVNTPEGVFLPTWMPNGYMLASFNETGRFITVKYSNFNGEEILYKESPGATNINLDTEDADIVENLTSNGNDGIYVKKGTECSIVLAESSRNVLILINGKDLSADILLKIANSIEEH